SCSSAEDAASDCGVFGSGNVIEFLGKISPPPSICELCTQYNYKYTGNASNQIKVLIPNTVLTHFPPNSQCVVVNNTLAGTLLPSGTGDANGFGVNILTHSMCQLPANFLSGTHFSILADPSTE